jgi:hypothetical protein
MQLPIGDEADLTGLVDLVDMKVRTRWQANLDDLLRSSRTHKGSVPTTQAVYFEGDQGRDVRVAEIPADMVDTVEEHRAQVMLLLLIVDCVTARTQICG